jgi:hypothetical protein
MSTTATARLVYGFKIPDGLDNCDIDIFACRFENRDNVGTFSRGRGDTFGQYLGIKLLESDADSEAQVVTVGLDAASASTKSWRCSDLDTREPVGPIAPPAHRPGHPLSTSPRAAMGPPFACGAA